MRDAARLGDLKGLHAGVLPSTSKTNSGGFDVYEDLLGYTMDIGKLVCEDLPQFIIQLIYVGGSLEFHGENRFVSFSLLTSIIVSTISCLKALVYCYRFIHIIGDD